jgi:predicted metal-dependent HD superfamily phosphohydrolase
VTRDLLDGWLTIVGSAPDCVRAGQRLLGRWQEFHRRYHDVRHLAAVLRYVDQLVADPGDPPNLAAVRLAAYFHDAVYDPQSPANEEASARLAVEVLGELGQPAERVAEVARLVRLTTDHRPGADDGNGALLCDADLAVLGGTPDAYAAYAADVRAEYASYPDEVFVPGRIAVLTGLLERPALYSTSVGRSRWEVVARRNLTAELDLLRGRGV